MSNQFDSLKEKHETEVAVVVSRAANLRSTEGVIVRGILGSSAVNKSTDNIESDFVALSVMVLIPRTLFNNPKQAEEVFLDGDFACEVLIELKDKDVDENTLDAVNKGIDVFQVFKGVKDGD